MELKGEPRIVYGYWETKILSAKYLPTLAKNSLTSLTAALGFVFGSKVNRSRGRRGNKLNCPYAKRLSSKGFLVKRSIFSLNVIKSPFQHIYAPQKIELMCRYRYKKNTFFVVVVLGSGSSGGLMSLLVYKINHKVMNIATPASINLK